MILRPWWEQGASRISAMKNEAGAFSAPPMRTKDEQFSDNFIFSSRFLFFLHQLLLNFSSRFLFFLHQFLLNRFLIGSSEILLFENISNAKQRNCWTNYLFCYYCAPTVQACRCPSQVKNLFHFPLMIQWQQMFFQPVQVHWPQDMQCFPRQTTQKHLNTGTAVSSDHETCSFWADCDLYHPLFCHHHFASFPNHNLKGSVSHGEE